ncbi:MAG: vitamin K epoxide reductase family protein [Thaumarchaeota archaeon]|nr:vitamin K epoxide reductase family protein [Nitrososphaerota archaeon]
MTYDWRSKSFIALAISGIAIAVYHAYGEITFTLNSCSFNKFLSCGSVFARGHTTVLGVSFWVYGIAWFPVCLALGLWVIRRDGLPNGSIMAPFLMIGNIFTLYPWFVEIKIDGGVFCPVCITLYVVNYLMTFVALGSRVKYEDEEDAPDPKTGLS